MKEFYTIKQLAEMLDRDRHTAWYHVRKLGVGQIVGRMFLLTQADVDHVINRAGKYNIKPDKKIEDIPENW